MEAQEDADYPPGLLATYEAGGRTIERVDADIAFDWESAAADPRLSDGPLTATWKGQLLVREPGRYKIHAYVEGEIEISIDGELIVSGGQDEAGWIVSNDLDMTFGEQPILVTYRRKSTHSGRVAIYWSAGHFPIEPIPAHLLFRDSPSPELRKIERGRLAWESHRCNRCHRRANDLPAPAAPSLTAIRDSIDSAWLVDMLRRPSGNSGHARMPSFGFSDDAARAVAAFLLSNADKPTIERSKEPVDADKERAAGRVLLHSVGCLACHNIGKLGTSGPFGGGDLGAIGRKRTVDWLSAWLEDPKRLNPDHRMPTVGLTATERHQLAMALSELRGDNDSEGTDSDSIPIDSGIVTAVARGGEIVRRSRCAACHRINNTTADLTGLPTLDAHDINWKNSCIDESTGARNDQPFYATVNAAEIRAFVESRIGELSSPGKADQGRSLLERRGCLACHQRGHSRGIASIAGRIAASLTELNGDSEALIPPALTAVGDKLIDSALAEAVRGGQKVRRLPWLHARMPRYQHSPDDEQALLQHLISHDRIPAGVHHHAARSTTTADNNEVLLAGHTLIGARGLSCIACHKVGDFEPRKLPIGTRGSDLKDLKARMRPEYYLRWTRSPMRIVPGMEMPSYRKAVPGVLNEEIDTQLMATWQALNDPRFTAPTDPASVEQFFTIQSDEPARIIRDVFTNSTDNGNGYTARSFAVGMHNGHNVLFDLDTVSVRDWTFGDMARQRTQGKSWYWDMAGVPVMTGFDTRSDVFLRQHGKSDAKPIQPSLQHGIGGRLIDYRNVDHGVELNYELTFELENGSVSIPVTELIAPLDVSGDFSGWGRSLEFGQVPSGFDILIEKPQAGANSIGQPRIESPDATGRASVTWPEADDVARDYFVYTGSDGSSVRANMHYVARLHRHAGELKMIQQPRGNVESVTSVPGFEGVRLPIETSIMPTAMTWTSDGQLAFTSLKGDVFVAHDTDGDGLQDKLTLFEEGLASPYGIIADGTDLVVSHKPEVIRLSDTDGDGRADHRTVVAAGWGYTSNYHDWACGIVRDSHGDLYIGLGSDYAQKDRPRDRARWRGAVLRIKPDGRIEVAGRSFRYPTGLAIDHQDRVFVTDNQGVQNTFNEINLLQNGGHYGVPSRYEENPHAEALWPAVQVPHPWSRSVNGLLILRDVKTEPQWLGHGIGCEYDSRFLMRFTVQQVGDTVQGAGYYFSRPHQDAGSENFVGPLCGTVAPNGDIYIGSIHDSGWLGGLNTGAITRLRRKGDLPNGIRELRATHDGFELEFLKPVDRQTAADSERYTISGYTREWGGNYATPDKGRYRVNITEIVVSRDARTVRLTVDRLEERYVYEVTCEPITTDDQPLWPATGHYTMTRIPPP